MPTCRSKLLLALPQKVRFCGLTFLGGISLIAIGIWAEVFVVVGIGCGVVLIAQLAGIVLSRK